MDYEGLYNTLKTILNNLVHSGIQAVNPQTLTILMDQLELNQKLLDQITDKGGR